MNNIIKVPVSHRCMHYKLLEPSDPDMLVSLKRFIYTINDAYTQWHHTIKAARPMLRCLGNTSTVILGSTISYVMQSATFKGFIKLEAAIRNYSSLDVVYWCFIWTNKWLKLDWYLCAVIHKRRTVICKI